MPRKIKSGLIQMSLPMTEGEGTIAQIKEAMIQKHIPFIEEAGKKAFRFYACRRFSVHHIFVPDRTRHGMNPLSRCPVLPLKECRNMRRNIQW